MKATSEISAGQAQQLEQMDPRERMIVFAGNNFSKWIEENPMRNTPPIYSGRVKRAYIDGFLAGMDRTLEAMHTPKGYWARFLDSDTGTVIRWLGSIALGFVIGFALLILSANVPVGQ